MYAGTRTIVQLNGQTNNNRSQLNCAWKRTDCSWCSNYNSSYLKSSMTPVSRLVRERHLPVSIIPERPCLFIEVEIEWQNKALTQGEGLGKLNYKTVIYPTICENKWRAFTVNRMLTLFYQHPHREDLLYVVLCCVGNTVKSEVKYHAVVCHASASGFQIKFLLYL